MWYHLIAPKLSLKNPSALFWSSFESAGPKFSGLLPVDAICSFNQKPCLIPMSGLEYCRVRDNGFERVLRQTR